jgi:creatinine amidohydrolase
VKWYKFLNASCVFSRCFMSEFELSMREYRYWKLTWPEINQAVTRQPVCVIPVGSIEQHGHHLPLDVDVVCPTGIATGAVRELAPQALLLPTVWNGYTAHVMDFPGTLNAHHTTFVDGILDVTKSLAYHGFKKILLLNGHGSNAPLLDLAARRTNLETDAECAALSWWSLLTVDPSFLPSWRESAFPGGCAHACELETSLYMYLEGGDVRTELIRDGAIKFNTEQSPYMWLDLFGSGPMAFVPWTSAYAEHGAFGEPSKATAEKGGRAYLEAVKQLMGLIQWWQPRPRDVRRDHHQTPPTMPMPWNQQSHQHKGHS